MREQSFTKIVKIIRIQFIIEQANEKDFYWTRKYFFIDQFLIEHNSKNENEKMMLTKQEIIQLPKVELHRHLDCSMKFSTMVEIARTIGLELPTTQEELKKYFLIEEPMQDLATVLRKFMAAQKLLNSEEVLTRLAFEACEDAFNDGVKIIEFRYAPTFINDGHPGLSFEKIHHALIKGIQLAEQKYDIAVGLICIIQRTKPLEVAQKVANFAIDNKDTFIALDLADNEDGFEPSLFAPVFQNAKKSGLHITVHSGEAPTAQSPQWVKDSISILGAERIGHGIQIINDIEVLQYVREKQIPLEVCPISNWLTQAFPNHESHPIRQLINAGIRTTINSDDPGIFNIQLSDDYSILQKYHNFTVADFKQCNLIAAQSSFIPQQKIQKYFSLWS